MVNPARDESNVRTALAAWLSVTRTLEPYSGLGLREAHRRADELLKVILRGGIRPRDVELSEDFKDVLSALVGSLRDFEPVDQRCSIADAVYKFIAHLEWQQSEMDEARDLLYESAVAGWKDLDAVYKERWANQSLREAPIGRASEARALIIQAGSEACRALQAGGHHGNACLSPVGRAVAVLSHFLNVWPSEVANQSLLICDVGERFEVSLAFDEKYHFLGEFSLLAGAALRQTGRRTEAGHWYSKASFFFGRTLRPAVGLLRIACEQAALDYETRNYSRAIAAARALLPQCHGSILARERFKCHIIMSGCHQDTGHVAEAISSLNMMRSDPDLERHPTFLVAMQIRLANGLALQQRYEEASKAHAEAFEWLSKIDLPLLRAHQKGILAESLRDQGCLEEAVVLYRMAIEDYTETEMMSLSAYSRVVLAETLVALGRYSEATLELQKALPTMDRENMTADGLAALALLREALRRQKVEPKALRDLCESLHLRR
jgi:tetratricopeptide (TPR) repeat protein